VISIWDVYLDAADAAVMLQAIEVLERHRAVREPLPIEDTATLLPRLRRIARLYADEARSWAHEQEDRGLEAEADGGRWGSPEAARRMRDTAEQLSAGSSRIAATAARAADDLEPRLADVPGDLVHEAQQRLLHEARRLLERHDEGQG
jgi:hypothetical protein